MKKPHLSFLQRAKLVEQNRSVYKKIACCAKNIEDQHVIVYTGAGINTNAGIPDFRGTQGLTEAMLRGDTPFFPELEKVQPTMCHLLLSLMANHRFAEHIVTQNCDGLQLRAGIKPEYITEIHGNIYTEVCHNCGKRYERTFDVTVGENLGDHKTSRHCDDCHHPLYDTLVFNKKEPIFEKTHNWNNAANAIRNAKAVIVFGSTCELIKKFEEQLIPETANIFIINKGETALDNEKNVCKISEDCDIVAHIIVKLIGTKITEVVKPYCRQCDPVLRLQSNNTKNILCSCERRSVRLIGDYTLNEAARIKPDIMSMMPSWIKPVSKKWKIKQRRQKKRKMTKKNKSTKSVKKGNLNGVKMLLKVSYKPNGERVAKIISHAADDKQIEQPMVVDTAVDFIDLANSPTSPHDIVTESSAETNNFSTQSIENNTNVLPDNTTLLNDNNPESNVHGKNSDNTNNPTDITNQITINTTVTNLPPPPLPFSINYILNVLK